MSKEKPVPAKERIKVRRRAIELVEQDLAKIDERLDKLFENLAETRRENNMTLIEPHITNKQREIRLNLYQNNMLEFQHEIAELFARKHELRSELVKWGDDLASLIADSAPDFNSPFAWGHKPENDLKQTDSESVGC